MKCNPYPTLLFVDLFQFTSVFVHTKLCLRDSVFVGLWLIFIKYIASVRKTELDLFFNPFLIIGWASVFSIHCILKHLSGALQAKPDG